MLFEITFMNLILHCEREWLFYHAYFVCHRFFSLFSLLCDSFNVTWEILIFYILKTIFLLVNWQNTCVGPTIWGHAKCRMVMDELRVLNHPCKIFAKDCFVDHSDISCIALDIGNTMHSMNKSSQETLEPTNMWFWILFNVIAKGDNYDFLMYILSSSFHKWLSLYAMVYLPRFTAGLAAALLLWPTITEQLHLTHNVHHDVHYECPTAKTGLLGGGAFLSLDSSLLWLIALMLAGNAREDFFEEESNGVDKGEYGTASSDNYYDADSGLKGSSWTALPRVEINVALLLLQFPLNISFWTIHMKYWMYIL